MKFDKYAWAPKDVPASIPIKNNQPRISMIMALDNFGKVYACMTQQNTDSKIFGLYIKELV